MSDVTHILSQIESGDSSATERLSRAVDLTVSPFAPRKWRGFRGAKDDTNRIISTKSTGRLPLVYDALRKLAAVRMLRESPDLTLQPTALVHEAYLRLVDVDFVQTWNSRGHFFAAAAEAMRRILVERGRHHSS